MSATQSIADTQLGFTTAELQILRQHQQIIAQQRAHRDREEQATRGRGTSRHSQPSSRGASVASSQSLQGRILLDPRSLQSLHTHLDSFARTLESRVNELEDATERSVQTSRDRAGNVVRDADAEIARMRRIIAEIDRLEEEVDRIKRIRDVIKALRVRVDSLGDKLESSRPSGSAQNDRHGGSRHDRHGSRR